MSVRICPVDARPIPDGEPYKICRICRRNFHAKHPECPEHADSLELVSDLGRAGDGPDVLRPPIGLKTEPDVRIPSAPAPESRPPARPGRSPAFGVLASVVACGLLGFAALVGRFALFTNDSLEAKMSDAIEHKRLLAPSPDNAYDLYHQPGFASLDSSTRARFDTQLLPVVTKEPEDVIAADIEPGGRNVKLADWKRSAVLLSWACEIRPNDATLRMKASYCSAWLAYKEKRYDNALAQAKTVVDLAPSWAPAWNIAGKIFDERGQRSDARAAYEKAMKLDSSWAIPIENYAKSYRDDASLPEAVRWHKIAINRAPGWATPHAWLGDCYLRLKDYDHSVQELEAALELDPNGLTGINIEDFKNKIAEAKRLADGARAGKGE